MSRKKNLRRLSVLVTAQTLYNLQRLADMTGIQNVGRVVDKLTREKMLALKGGSHYPPISNPNKLLTQADLAQIHFERVWIYYGMDENGERCGEDGVVLYGRLYSLETLGGAGFEELLRDAMGGETLDRPTGQYKVFKRPLESNL